MNPHLREALKKQSMRQKLRKEIRSARGNTLNEEYESGLYKAFVQPFTDVLQAVNLGAQDILNSFVLHLRTFITFDPAKIQDLHRSHDETKAKIAEKWKPLMERTDAALSTGDADVIALAFAPGAFAISALGSTVANYAGDINTFIDASGLGGFKDGLVPGGSSDSSSRSGGSGSESGGLLGGDLLDNLTKLFFVGTAGSAVALGLRGSSDTKKESVKLRKSVLSESPKEDFAKDFANLLDVTGIDDALKEDGEKIFDSLKETVENMKAEVVARETLVNEIESASSLSEFVNAFDKAYESEGAPTSNPPDVKKLESELSAAVDKLAASPEFIEKAKDMSNKSNNVSESDNPSNVDIKDAAEKTVFLDAKKQFQDNTQKENQSVDDLKAEIAPRVKEMLPSPAGMKILKMSNDPGAKEVVEFVESTKQFFGI